MNIVLWSEFDASSINEIVSCLQNMGHTVRIIVTSPGLARNLTEEKLERYRRRIAAIDCNAVVLGVQTIRSLPSILSEIPVDLLLTMKCAFRLSDSILDIPRLGSVNFHPSLLPHYRGPIQLVGRIMNGEPRVGYTFHYMTAEYDTGPIIVQGEIDISEEDDIRSIVARIVPDVIMSQLPRVLRAVFHKDPGTEQDHSISTYAPSFSPEQKILDWRKPIREISRQVRSMAFHGAVGMTNLGKYRVFACRECTSTITGTLPIGTEVPAPLCQELLVRTADGYLVLTEYVRIA